MLAQEVTNVIPRYVRESRLHFIVSQNSVADKPVRYWDKLLPVIRYQWGRNFTYSTIRCLMELQDLVPFLMEKGYKKIIVVGGDGVFNQVVNCLYSINKKYFQNLTFGLISSDAGQGVACSLGLPKKLDDQLKVISSGKIQQIDLGIINYLDFNGKLQQRVFINEIQLGMAVRSMQALKGEIIKLFRKKLLNLISIIKLLHSKAAQINLIFENSTRISAAILGVVVGNGAISAFGRQAQLRDSLLDVLLIDSQYIKKRLKSQFKVYQNTHKNLSGLSYYQSRKIEITSQKPVWVTADGELVGKIPCKITIVPKALNVFATSGDLC